MKRDGTIYLARIHYENGIMQWELVHWGRPIGLSDPMGKPTWCNQKGFALRNHAFIKTYPLDNLLANQEAADKVARINSILEEECGA